jgi:hypothetical protein
MTQHEQMMERQRIANAQWLLIEWAQGSRGGWKWAYPLKPDDELAKAIEAFRQRKLAEI